MSKTFVVPDAHGNHHLVLGLLEQEGLIYADDDGVHRRLDKETLVVQLGDLANCVRPSINDDLTSLRLVGTIIDIMLIGNHEHPYFLSNERMGFNGFCHYFELQHLLVSMNNRGLIQAALEVDGILLTHAGVTRDIDGIDEWENPDNKAAEVADALNTLWKRRDFTHFMFAAVGQIRGGMHPNGGVLWSDWKEPKSQLIPQIVGHSVGESWRAVYPANGEASFLLERPYQGASPVPVQVLCIDIGAGKNATSILGAWIDNGKVKIVEHSET